MLDSLRDHAESVLTYRCSIATADKLSSKSLLHTLRPRLRSDIHAVHFVSLSEDLPLIGPQEEAIKFTKRVLGSSSIPFVGLTSQDFESTQWLWSELGEPRAQAISDLMLSADGIEFVQDWADCFTNRWSALDHLTVTRGKEKKSDTLFVVLIDLYRTAIEHLLACALGATPLLDPVAYLNVLRACIPLGVHKKKLIVLSC